MQNVFTTELGALASRCPDRVDAERWRGAIDDARQFIGAWGEKAATLGWTAADLFALHPTKPLSRFDHMGAIWCLKGRSVLGVTERSITIQGESGSALAMYRRKG